MLTISQTVTTEKTLTTQKQVLAHIRKLWAERRKLAPFQPGDAVRITNRLGIPDSLMAGDVAVVAFADISIPGLIHLVGVNASGSLITFPVAMDNLAPAA